MKMSIITVTIFAIFVSMNEARVLTKTENQVKTSEKSDTHEVAVVTTSEVREKVNNAIVNKMKDVESVSNKSSNSVSQKSIIPEVKVVVNQETNQTPVLLDTPVHNNSEESSLKTDSSMQDYDLNQSQKPDNKSHNSDIIEETVVTTHSQILDENNSNVEEASTKKEKSEGLKIASVFMGIVTLIALF